MKNFSIVSLMRARSGLVAIAASAIVAISISACSRSDAPTDQSSGASVLTNTKLVDQNGNSVSLSSLRGKPMLVDFIYTSCPGPCMMETAKLANVALRLGGDLGSKYQLVSITVDPEHDGPKQLLNYAQQQGADQKGWYFLTGSPADVDAALAGFKIVREHEPGGEVAHVVEMVLVGADGNTVREYNGEVVKAQDIVDDLKKTGGNG